MNEKPILKKRNTGLGRGLSALLSDNDNINRTELDAEYALGSINEIAVESIETNPFQPRTDFDRDQLQELADSIKIHGVIQPITVRRLDKNNYQIISGERRYQAAQLIGLQYIPAYIRTANDQEMLEMALIENTHRADLNPIEIALSYQRLISECNLLQEEMAERVSKNRATVSNYLRLLKLPPDIQIGLRDRKLDIGHARALINVEKVETQLTIFKRIIAEGLTVRKVEELVRSLAEVKENTKTESKPKDFEVRRIQDKLSGKFGTKVLLKHTGANKGEIRIPFLSNEDLNRILEIL